MTNIIEINNLNFKNLFNDLSILIEENKFITISGPNNSGKTTLLRILNRNIQLNEEIRILDKEINTRKIDEHLKIIQAIFPKEIIFSEKALKEELYFLADGNEKEKTDYINFLASNLKIKKILSKSIKSLSDKEIILAQISIALINKPKILIIDNLNDHFNEKELKYLFEFFYKYREKYGLTLIITTIDLNNSLYTDYLFILSDGKVALSGEPYEILQKDNIINKIGLNIPFMIDLSVKLRDYDLLNTIETDLDGMIDKLWS